MPCPRRTQTRQNSVWSRSILQCMSCVRDPAQILQHVLAEHAVLVSRDVHLLEMRTFRGVQILQLAQFKRQVLGDA